MPNTPVFTIQVMYPFGRIMDLFQFKRSGIELVVGAPFRDQPVMGAPFNDAPVVQYHDVGILDRGKAVRDHKHRLALHQLIHAVLHQRLHAGVDGAGRLVQNHDRWIRHRRPRNGNQLPLSLGQSASILFQKLCHSPGAAFV